MNERDWLILATLYKEQNISKTAKAMFISQSALSLRIKYIEEYFNVKLLERTTKGIYFTPAGKMVAEFAEQYNVLLNDFKAKLEVVVRNSSGELRIGMSPILTRYIAPKVITDFSTLHPNVNFRIVSKKNSELLDELRNGSIHIAFLRTEAIPHGFAEILLAEEPVYVTSANPIELSDLPQLPLVDYRNDPHFRSEFQSWWQNNFPTSINKIIHVSDSEACKEIVKQGIGFGFFPALLIQDSPELYKIRVNGKNKQPLMRKTRLVYKDVIPQDPAIERFVEFMKEHNYLQTVD